MLDVPAEDVRRVDGAGMLDAVLGLPGQIRDLLEAEVPEVPESFQVLVAGMGGSAIGGSYLAAWADEEGDVPVTVARGYEVPSWVDEDTLVLCVSYSGETEETLSAFADARERGATIAAISTGGRLARYAKKAGAPFLAVPAGLQPRAALGAMLSAEALVLESAGVLEARPALEEAVKTLEAMAPDLAADVAPPRNEGKRVAMALQGTIPAVYGAGILVPVATRFANQLQENAKTLAWAGSFPEMNHNEIVGWWGTDRADGASAVFLRDRREGKALEERWAFTADVIRAQGAPILQLEARGEHLLARQLSLTMLADAASVYLGVLRNLDPTPVDVIRDLKTRVAKAGVVAETDRRVG